MTNINHIERYAKLENQKAELKDALVAIEAHLDELRPGVLDYMQSHSIDQLKSAGRTLYLKRELWAGRPEDVTPEDLSRVLSDLGMDDFHADAPKMQALSAWLRELDKSGEKMPAGLEPYLVANETFKIGSRRS